MLKPLLLLLLLARCCLGEEELCSWCEAGSCVLSPEIPVQKTRFRVSISDSIGGRTFPVWIPEGQVGLGESDLKATAAVIVFHGAARNGDEYTEFVANVVSEALVFGAQVYEAGDPGLDADEDIWWETNTDDGFDDESVRSDWHWGGDSTGDLSMQISSFLVLDEMITTLLNPIYYPRLEQVILAGHSAGGQIVQRYALFSKIFDTRVKYFVGNPSSMTYLSSTRPILPTCCSNATILHERFQFYEVPFETIVDCPSYDTYGYGLRGNGNSYVSSVDTLTSLANYEKRNVYYLSGSADVCSSIRSCSKDCVEEDGGLDLSCEAELQGPCRLFRMHAFYQHLQEFFGKRTHTLLSVDDTGHSGCGILQSSAFLQAAFPPVTPVDDVDFSSDGPSFSFSCEPKTAYFCFDSPSRVSKKTIPGTVLVGGSTYEAFVWQLKNADHGNFLIVSDGANYFQDFCEGSLAAFATLVLHTREAASDPFVLQKVGLADAIFFANGDTYVERISDTPLQSLLDLQSSKVTIGGTGILGNFIYTGPNDLSSTTSLNDPYATGIDLAPRLLSQNPLIEARVITDSDFFQQDRMGRLVTLLARLSDQNPRGIGIDADAAVLVDDDGELKVVGHGNAYLCEIRGPIVCQPEVPLSASNVSCYKLTGQEDTQHSCEFTTGAGNTNVFDVAEWATIGASTTFYSFDVIQGNIHGSAYGPATRKKKATIPADHETPEKKNFKKTDTALDDTHFFTDDEETADIIFTDSPHHDSSVSS